MNRIIKKSILRNLQCQRASSIRIPPPPPPVSVRPASRPSASSSRSWTLDSNSSRPPTAGASSCCRRPRHLTRRRRPRRGLRRSRRRQRHTSPRRASAHCWRLGNPSTSQHSCFQISKKAGRRNPPRSKEFATTKIFLHVLYKAGR